MIERIGEGEIEQTAALLAGAFDGDAGYRYLFPRDRRDGLADLFRRNLRVHLPYGCTWVWSERGAVRATVTVRPPSGVPISLATLVRHGLAPFAWSRGLRATRRLLWLKRTYDELEHTIARGAPHWHVHMMAVEPGAQGQGLGTRLLVDALARATDRDRSAPIVLTTHDERNVRFYHRLGFGVTDLRQLEPPDGEPYAVWSMRCDPV
jgi:ribosomal protein S18 acetylase RimI-like enzyme